MTELQEQNQNILQQQEINLADYINIIFRRRKVFVTVFLTVLVSVILYTFLMRPVYQSSSTVYVSNNNAKLGINELVMSGGNNSIQAEIEIIKSRTIAEQVVRKLNLEWKITPSSATSTCKILDIATPPAVKTLKVTMTGKESYEVEDGSGKKLGRGKNGTPLSLPGILLNVQFSGYTGDSFELTHIPLYKAAAAIKSAIKVKEVGRMTNVIEVSYENTNASLARDVVNTVVQAYLDQSLAFKSQEAGKSVSFIEEQLQNIKNELNKAEVNLQEYKTSAGVVKLDAEAEELIRKFSSLEQERVGLNLRKKQLEFALDAQRETLAQGTSYSPAVMRDDPGVAGMAQQLASLEVQKRSLLVEYTTNHPSVQNVQAQIDEIQQKIRSTYKTGLKNLTKQESDVTQHLSSYEGQLRGIPVEERDLVRYTRLAKVTGDIYTFLLQKHEEARIAKASTISNINVIDTAIIPATPVRPEKAKYLLLGFFISIIAAIALSLLIDYLDDTVKNENEAKNLLGFPYLATIPYIGKGEDGKNEEENLSIISHTKQKSIPAEAFRSLRTALHFSTLNQKRKVIVLTSAFSGEGKSTISTNLAITAALTGSRTVLIDCDFHKSTLYQRIGMKQIPGVTEVLAGDVSLATALQPTIIKDLTFFSTGTPPPNPSVLLGSPAMKELIERLREMFDQIIIDAPPTLPVSDSIVLTSCADLVLVVMEAGRIPRKAATRLSEMLQSAKAPVAGFVFNN
ncbi:MAG: polysaccharide biosynthesis tyrosine autokinase, partial [Chlorobiaceae bacterium]